MRIYLAARYSRREELCGYRTQLQEQGHAVTSRWLNGAHQISDVGVPIGDKGEALVEGDDGTANEEAAALRSAFATEDVADVWDANCIVSFTEPPRAGHSRGGRHVEYGIALGMWQDGYEMRICVVGHRENLFHWLPNVEFYTTWDECFEALIAQGVR